MAIVITSFNMATQHMVYESKYNCLWTLAVTLHCLGRKKKKTSFDIFFFFYISIIYHFWTSAFYSVEQKWYNLHHWLIIKIVIILYVLTVRTGTANYYNIIHEELLTEVDYWALPQFWTTLSHRTVENASGFRMRGLIPTRKYPYLILYKQNGKNSLRSGEYPTFILSILFHYIFLSLA